jgi:glycerophosphoryl diester phosphodiesterase
MNRNFISIGHRGTRILDENTIYAFTKAIKYGVDYIEFDVRKTKDNQLIVIHDMSLERTTIGSGLIKNLTYNEISKYTTKRNNEKIPLFSDVIDTFKGKIKFMIELKAENIRSQILDIIIEEDLINSCIFSGRVLKDIVLIKNEYPETKICYNITKGIGLSLSEFLKCENQEVINSNLDMVSLRSNLISSKFIERCRKNKLMALSWDFINYSNPLEKIKELIKNGINGILFDNYKNIPLIKDWLCKN